MKAIFIGYHWILLVWFFFYSDNEIRNKYEIYNNYTIYMNKYFLNQLANQ
jgi:hypothetical protein